MKITDIDKDFVDIINNLNDSGFRPWASCDGVDRNHDPDKKPIHAYISFLNSSNIIDLMSALYKDKENFSIEIRTPSHVYPYYYYENLIEGLIFSVRFENHNSERTDYFSRIINGVIDKSIKVGQDETRLLTDISNLLGHDDNSLLYLEVCLNYRYHMTSCLDERINSISIGSKSGSNRCLDMEEALNKVSQDYGLEVVEYYDKKFVDKHKEFIYKVGQYYFNVYLTDENVNKIPEIIQKVQEMEKDLKTCKSSQMDEPGDMDEEYLDDDDFII